MHPTPPPLPFGAVLHRIVRQCDARVLEQLQRLRMLRAADPFVDLAAEARLLRVLHDTRREAHDALRHHLAGYAAAFERAVDECSVPDRIPTR